MISRRSYLILKSRQPSQQAFPVPLCVAMEAVATMALEHPEWDMDEIKTWDQRERLRHRMAGRAEEISSRISKVPRSRAEHSRRVHCVGDHTGSSPEPYRV
jgi:hypothetical protein